MMSPEEVREVIYGKREVRPRVAVTYRVKGQQQTTTRTFEHEAYLAFVQDMDANGYQMVSAEQER